MKLANDAKFLDDVLERHDDNFRRCLQCQSCAGGCPVAQSMIYRPNGIIRLIQFGEKKEVLNRILFQVKPAPLVDFIPTNV